jgi:manganese transport protein
MEGFINLRIRPWLRRLLTRSLAIIPAVIVVKIYGDKAVDDLLLLSQVILSAQLSFAVFPLVQFTCEKAKMGRFVNARWLAAVSWLIAIIIAGLNVYNLFNMFMGNAAPGGH